MESQKPTQSTHTIAFNTFGDFVMSASPARMGDTLVDSPRQVTHWVYDMLLAARRTALGRENPRYIEMDQRTLDHLVSVMLGQCPQSQFDLTKSGDVTICGLSVYVNGNLKFGTIRLTRDWNLGEYHKGDSDNRKVMLFIGDVFDGGVSPASQPVADVAKKPMSFERYTDRSRKIIQLAKQEADRFNDDRIDTDHVLIALLKEGSGVAAHVLKNRGLDLRKIREAVEGNRPRNPKGGWAVMSPRPYSDDFHRMHHKAAAIAGQMNHAYVGTEHLLYALASHPALASLGMTAESVVAEIESLLGFSLAGSIACDPAPKTIEEEKSVRLGSVTISNVTDLKTKSDPIYVGGNLLYTNYTVTFSVDVAEIAGLKKEMMAHKEQVMRGLLVTPPLPVFGSLTATESPAVVEPPKDFQIGDRVQIDCPDWKAAHGLIGTIEEIVDPQASEANAVKRFGVRADRDGDALYWPLADNVKRV